MADYENEPDAVRTTTDDLARALFGNKPALWAHLMEDGQGVQGMALWFLNFSTWQGVHGIYLEDFYVRPMRRGRGYGTLLLAELARICVERGYARLDWSCLAWNRPSHEYYRARGAVPQLDWVGYRLEAESLAEIAGLGT